MINAEVALPDKAVVRYDPKKTTPAKLINAVKKAGYKAEVKKEKSS